MHQKKFHGTGVYDQRRQNRIIIGKSRCGHKDTVCDPQKQVSRKNRNSAWKCGSQGRGTFMFFHNLPHISGAVSRRRNSTFRQCECQSPERSLEPAACPAPAPTGCLALADKCKSAAGLSCAAMSWTSSKDDSTIWQTASGDSQDSGVAGDGNAALVLILAALAASALYAAAVWTRRKKQAGR